MADVLFKLRRLPLERLAQLCLGCTVLAMLPSMLLLFWRPTRTRWIYGMVACSLAFFLFSYQGPVMRNEKWEDEKEDCKALTTRFSSSVHEKTILFPAVAMAVLMVDAPVASMWFAVVANFSMYPLLHKV